MLIVDFEGPALGSHRSQILRLTPDELELEAQQFKNRTIYRKLK